MRASAKVPSAWALYSTERCIHSVALRRSCGGGPSARAASGRAQASAPAASARYQLRIVSLPRNAGPGGPAAPEPNRDRGRGQVLSGARSAGSPARQQDRLRQVHHRRREQRRRGRERGGGDLAEGERQAVVVLPGLELAKGDLRLADAALEPSQRRGAGALDVEEEADEGRGEGHEKDRRRGDAPKVGQARGRAAQG